MNENRRILSAKKCRPVTSFLCYKVHADIREGFPGEGASNDSEVVKNGNFQRFRGLFFGNFRNEASVII